MVLMISTQRAFSSSSASCEWEEIPQALTTSCPQCSTRHNVLGAGRRAAVQVLLSMSWAVHWRSWTALLWVFRCLRTHWLGAGKNSNVGGCTLKDCLKWAGENRNFADYLHIYTHTPPPPTARKLCRELEMQQPLVIWKHLVGLSMKYALRLQSSALACLALSSGFSSSSAGSARTLSSPLKSLLQEIVFQEVLPCLVLEANCASNVSRASLIPVLAYMWVFSTSASVVAISYSAEWCCGAEKVQKFWNVFLRKGCARAS